MVWELDIKSFTKYIFIKSMIISPLNFVEINAFNNTKNVFVSLGNIRIMKVSNTCVIFIKKSGSAQTSSK